MKRYSELIQYSSFDDRFNYLKLSGRIGKDTFGFDRYLNQDFYQSSEWRRFRDKIIIRDEGCEMGLRDFPITDWIIRNGMIIRPKIIVHHINPLSKDDILAHSDLLFDPENVICVSDLTHKAIHYGDLELAKPKEFKERTPFDTCPWRKGANCG